VRNLRINQTLAERIVWGRLRNRQLDGFKFRRQYYIGNFIVDSYCSETNLIIETDGDVHGYAERTQKDRTREEFLRSKNLELYGIITMKFIIIWKMFWKIY
jgi:very-short-patch-repair endonuclease